MAPGMCRRCNKRRAQYMCQPCLDEEARRHPLYLRPDLLQGAGYAELLRQGTSLLALADPNGTAELMDGPPSGKAGPLRLSTALRLLGSEEQGSAPFPLVRGDADELHELLAKFREVQSTADGARALAEIYAFLSSVPGLPDNLRGEWKVLASGLFQGRPPEAKPAAPSPTSTPMAIPRAISEEALNLAQWEERLKALEERVIQQRSELGETQRVTEEKQSYLAQLDKTLRTKETTLQKWEAQLRDLETTVEKERVRTNDLMKNLEALQTHLTTKEQDLNVREVDLVKREEMVKARETNIGATEQALAARARDTVLKELKEQQDKIANEQQMVDIWRQALSAKEQELEERMKALEEERKRMTKPSRSKKAE